jgi:hypothetical protein
MQPAVESVSVWNIIVVVLIPIVGIGFGLLLRMLGGAETRQRLENERLWTQINALRDQAAAYAIDAERRYINQQSMQDFKTEIFKRFDRLDRHIDSLIGNNPDKD